MRGAIFAIALVACGKSEPAAKSSPGSATASVRSTTAWPVAPAPTLPVDTPWPPTLESLASFANGVRVDDLTVYAETSPTYFPRLWIKGDLDLITLERAWGTLTRDRDNRALWWNPKAGIRARFDAQHSNPSLGRGVELAPYVSTLDRVANLDELVIDKPVGRHFVLPGEWDAGAVAVVIDDANPGRRMTVTLAVKDAPVDEAAVIAKLRSIWGAYVEAQGVWVFEKERITVRRDPSGLEITYLVP